MLVAELSPDALVAQNPAAKGVHFDVSLGFTMNTPIDVNRPPHCTELGLPCLTPRTFPDFGLAAQAAVYPLEHAALVLEGSTYGNHWVDSNAAEPAPRAGSSPADDNLVNRVAALLGGVRLSTGTFSLPFANDSSHCRAYVQVLGGPEASTVLPTRFAIQPGAGFDGQLRWPRAWLRVAYDYRSTRGSGRNLSGPRVVIAMVLDSGRE